MALDFRYADVSDIEKIVEIENDAMSNPWKASDYLEAIQSDHAYVFVASENESIAGFAVFYLTPPESELPDIVVSENYRKRGVGKALLQYGINELKSYNVNTIFLEVRVSNIAARTLYEHMGFEEIGKRKYFYSNPVEDAICMSWHGDD